VFDEDPAGRCLMRVMKKFDKRKPHDWTGAFVPIDPPPTERP
jgi:hypothetical protein